MQRGCSFWVVRGRMLLGLLLLLFSVPVLGQKKFGKKDAWFTLNTSYRFNAHWKVDLEQHYRFDDGWRDREQLLIRPALHYVYNTNSSWAVGGSYILTFPYGEYPVKKDKPEINVWEQLLRTHQQNKWKFGHRYRWEQRWISKWSEKNTHYEWGKLEVSHRWRYRFSLSYALSEKWKVMTYDEVWITSNRTFRQIEWDRNWWSLGCAHRLNTLFTIQMSYLHQYIRHTSDMYEKHPTLILQLGIHLG